MTERTILLIRHGESTFNAAQSEGAADPMLFDAPLTARGHAQVAAARLALRDRRMEAVITSPLTRALQTTLGLFGDHPDQPRIAVEVGHRERLESSCDQGRSPLLLAREFPTLALDHLPETWWHDEGEPNPSGIRVEPVETLLARLADFVEALRARPERHLAVVGHGTFFHHLTGRWLANCEIVEWDGAPVGRAAA